MKKNYLFIAALLIAGTALGQDTIWSDDFSAPSNWVMSDSSNPSATWIIDTVAPIGGKSSGMGKINSTSGGNFALFDGDGQCVSCTTQVSYLTIANSIDMSSHPGAILEFESYYQRWLFSNIYVEVSNDGTNWTFTEALCPSKAECGLGVDPPGNISSNPEKISINVSSVAANQSTVWIRFKYTGGSSFMGGDYAWMIDDVVLLAPPTNNLSLGTTNNNGIWKDGGKQYSYIPVKQVSANPLSFESIVINGGTNNQTNTKLWVSVNDGSAEVFLGTSNSKTVSNLSQDTLAITANYTPTATGTYTVSLWAVSDSTTSIDTITSTFTITDTIYGRDNNVQQNVALVACNLEFEVGNFFKMYTDQKATSISMYVSSSSKEGAQIYGTLWNFSGTPTSMTTTSDYTLQASDTNGGWITLPLIAPTNLTSGNTYLVTAGWKDNGNRAYFGVSGTILTSNETTIRDIGDCFSNCEWCSNYEYIPMVRLIVDGKTPSDISEINNSIGTLINPNPSAGQFNIEFINAKKDDYTFDVINILGQTVYSEQITISGNFIKQIDITSLNKGIYFLNISNSEAEKNHKIIIN